MSKRSCPSTRVAWPKVEPTSGKSRTRLLPVSATKRSDPENTAAAAWESVPGPATGLNVTPEFGDMVL